MKKQNLFILGAMVVLLLGSCKKADTHYVVKYQFDNNDFQSEFFEVVELTDSGANGKWRSNLHHLDTVYIDGVMHEMASGEIDEPARPDCTCLQVSLSGYRPGSKFLYLDTVFTLTLGEYNHFEVTPDMTWHLTNQSIEK